MNLPAAQMAAQVLALLQCPTTGAPLAYASAGMLDRARQMAHAGKLSTTEQKAIKRVDGLLVTPDLENGYRAEADVWWLAPTDLIPLHQLKRAADLAARKQRRAQATRKPQKKPRPKKDAASHFE